MQIRNLGGSGLRVSAVGLGCNNFGQRTDLETSRKVIHKAIDLGITLFDTADIYAGMGGSETVLGQVLGDRRKDIVLATKYSKPMSQDGTKQGASRRYILSAVEASLTRLKTDYIDLYQQHDYDPLTPIEESLRALDDLVRQGKVRFIGCSNLLAQQVSEAQDTAQRNGLAAFVSCQDEYSLLVRGIERELNAGFAPEGRLDPFRFFAIDNGAEFYLGLAYDHFVAGGDSIVILLQGMVARYLNGTRQEGPTQIAARRYGPTYAHLFRRQFLACAKALLSLPNLAASCRRAFRPRDAAPQEKD